jgi:outer membrane protein TolC
MAVLAFCAHAADLADFFASAESVNEDFSRMTIDLELASLRHERNRIEATDELRLLAADSALLLAQSAHRQSIGAYYNDVLDSVYGAAVADLELRIALRSEEVSREDERAAADQVQRGLAPQRDLVDARTSVQSAAVESEQKRWQRQDRLDELAVVTGLSWADVALPDVEVFTVLLDAGQWIERDLAVKRARIEEQIAQTRRERLATNAPRFDRMTVETEHERALLTTQRAVASSGRAYVAMVRRLTAQAQIIAIRSSELELDEDLYQEAQDRYGRGFMNAADRDRTAVLVLSAQRSLVQAQLDYLKTVMEYAIVAGLSPSEVL